MEQETFPFYRNKKVLITGGLGFIGSNLAHALVPLGAHVTIVDTLDPKFGGNNRNIEGIESSVALINQDILICPEKLVVDQDVIFHFAGQINPGESNRNPVDDFTVNSLGTLKLLEACRIHNPGVRFIFSSSRLAVGRPAQIVLTESDSGDAKTFYGIHKAMAEEHCRLYYQQYGLRTTVLRLTNPYGERQQMKHPGYGVIAWFMRQALEDNAITIYGTGDQLRDYIYIKDVIEAFLLAGALEKTSGKRYFCGFGSSISLKTMAQTIIDIVGSGRISHIPWPQDEAAKETGDCTVSIASLCTDTRWKPSVSFVGGITRMAEYFQKNLTYYT